LRISIARDLGLFGGTNIPASPTTSHRLGTLDAITGFPEAIASSGGYPKPSHSVGNIKMSQNAYRYGRR